MPGDGERNEHELARTATAPGASTPAAQEAPALGATLGRYRLERELGAGGMGVVHAAFDPDLERRVALKVLRLADTGEARQRLLREARALARLTHPNVVTVHEVGSATGRDYVAMELIEGETLADWLKAAARSPDDILAAFSAAGRGLAAAHAAGLVHRDFKPHNVLRRKDGRIVVTDFGLARGIEVAIELETTMRARGPKPAADDNTPSPLSGLTETGSVLGTPAYMAPEQWSGDSVGPAADQFAFCVALWEALAGDRPFKGATLEALQLSVSRGPSELDDSKLPRRLRAPLKRGLDPNPARRWPSMDALLAAISRADRSRGVLLMIGASAVIASVVAYAVFAGDGKQAAPALACEQPVLDPAQVWSPTLANQVRDKTSSEIMRRFDTVIGGWQSARSVACGLDTPARSRRLACLDGVIARFDAVRKASVLANQPDLDDISGQLIDPGVCNVDDPPRLPSKLSEAVPAAFALAYQREPNDDFDTQAEAAALKLAGEDRCARALIKLARASQDEATARASAEEAVELADSCGDDRIRADALVLALAMQINVFLDPKLQKALATAETAVRKVSQPEVVAMLDMIKISIANVSKQYDEAIKLADSAIRGFGERMPMLRLQCVVAKAEALNNRRRPGDLKLARAELARWRPEALRANRPRIVTRFDLLDANLQWELGDVAGANARLPALRAQEEQQRKKPLSDGSEVTGTVVDGAGKPVANALVAAHSLIGADSVSIGYLGDGVRLAHTDADGRFRLDHVPKDSIIVAELGDLRSHARPVKSPNRLVLQPTTTIAGKVTGSPETQVVFVIQAAPNAPSTYRLIAPVASDGSFTLHRVPIGRLRVGAAQLGGGISQAVVTEELTVGPGGRNDLVIHPAEARKLHVVARSAVSVPLAGAQVLVIAGNVQAKTVKDLENVVRSPGVSVEFARPLTGETPPELGKLATGDLVAKFANAPTGAASACAIGLTGDITDRELLEKVQKNVDKLDVRCVPVPPDAKAVTIELPPMKRLD